MLRSLPLSALLRSSPDRKVANFLSHYQRCWDPCCVTWVERCRKKRGWVWNSCYFETPFCIVRRVRKGALKVQGACVHQILVLRIGLRLLSFLSTWSAKFNASLDRSSVVPGSLVFPCLIKVGGEWLTSLCTPQWRPQTFSVNVIVPTSVSLLCLVWPSTYMLLWFLQFGLCFSLH